MSPQNHTLIIVLTLTCNIYRATEIVPGEKFCRACAPRQRAPRLAKVGAPPAPLRLVGKVA